MALFIRRVRALVRHRRTPVIGVFLIATLCATWLSTWRPQAQNQRDPDTTRRADRVSVRPDAEGADYGTTFHTFESRATAVRTRFGNATTVAERSVDGDLRVRLHDTIGNEIAKLTIHRQNAERTDLEFTDGASVVELAAARDTVPTLNWANLQAYALWADKAPAGGAFQWRDRLVRSTTGRQNIASLVREVRTEFQGDIVATTSVDLQGRTRNPGARPTFVTSITVQGAEVGKMAWYAQEQLLAWNFAGLTSGSVNSDKLRPVGGWNFTPTMAWANVQALAFYDLHTRLKFQGKVAERRSNWLQRISAQIVPVLQAQDGCTGMHWLDYTVYRPCCDVHDMCYQAYGCTKSSWWWPFGSSWQCTGCNAWAAFCFSSGGCGYYPCWDVPNP
jgi:hypothetical protein